MHGRRSETEVSIETWNRRALQVLILFVWLRGVAPGLVNFLFEVHFSSNVSDTLVRAPLASTFAEICSLLLIVSSLVILMFGRPSGRRSFSSLAALLLVPTMTIAYYASVQTISPNLLIDQLTLVALLGAVWRLKPMLHETALIAYLAAAVAVYAVLFAILNPSHAFFGNSYGLVANSDKALIGSNLLAGPFGHSNTLGTYLALSMPFALYIKNLRTRFILLVVCAFTMAWSGSRSSLIAAGTAALLTMIVSRTHGVTRKVFVTGALSSLALFIIILPFTAVDPNVFSRRGAIWLGSIREWERNAWWGSGLDWYSRIGLFANDLGAQASSGHNLLVTLLATGGIVSAFVCAVILTGSARRAYRSTIDAKSNAPFYFLTTFLTLSATEFVWVFSTSGELFLPVGFAIACLLLGSPPGTTRAQPEIDDHAQPQDKFGQSPPADTPIRASEIGLSR